MYKNCTLLCGTRPRKSLVKAIQVADFNNGHLIIAQTSNPKQLCYRHYQNTMKLISSSKKMEKLSSWLFHINLIHIISAKVLTLKDLRQDFEFEKDCNFNGKLIRAIIGLSNPNTRVASGYTGKSNTIHYIKYLHAK